MINADRLVSLFTELVTIDTPSKSERVMADRIKSHLADLGFTVTEDQAGAQIGGNCGNLIARLPGSLALEPLLFCAHLDTVEPARGKRALTGADGVMRSGGDTVLGADDLAGVAAIIEAVRAMLETGRAHRPIEILFTVAEECHLLGSRHLDVSGLSARQGYVLDASGEPGRGVVQAPGHISLHFTIRGLAAHAGMCPENGVSAITAAARGIAAMRLGRVDAQTTANIGRIEGGGETNVVADLCSVTAECRSQEQTRLDEQADHLCSCMEQAAADMGATVHIRRQQSYAPYRIASDSPVVQRFTEACARLSLPVHLEAGGGGSDNNVLVLHGITGMVIACGMDQIHSCQEQLPIRDLVNTARIVEQLIELP